MLFIIHTLKVLFTNNAYIRERDRFFVVDVVSLYETKMVESKEEMEAHCEI